MPQLVTTMPPRRSGRPPKRFVAIGLAGSLRRDSFNRRLLEAAARLAPPDLEIRTMPIGKLPHYDADVDAAGPPRSVARFKAAIEAADGLVVATPEYNAGVSGVLKNAIDWASRPAYQSPLVGKPVLLIGATPGRGGARRALEELRRELESTRAEPLPRSLSVASVHEKLGGDTILDPETRRSLAELLVELRDEIARRKAGEEATEDARRGAASRAS